MLPSKISRRAAILSSLTAGTFALALAATPAQAIGIPKLGDTCVVPTPLLTSLNLTCTNLKVVALPIPTSAPTSAAPSAAPTTTPPNPLGGLTSTVTGTAKGLAPGAAGASQAVNSAVGSLLGGSLPTTTPTAPGVPGTSTAPGTSTGKNGGTAKPGSPLTKSSKAPSTQDGSSLLGPAAAFLPGASLASFADLSSSYGDLLPLADNIPSPLIASAQGRLAAVQAPLIAAGQRASSQADSGLFTRFGGKALPGLLVVIGTALVAAVGAGNLRAWQARFGSVNLRAWKRSAK